MKRQIKLLAVLSTAAILSASASFITFAANGWMEENGGWSYYNEKGERVADNWVKSGDNWFWLDGSGAMAFGGLLQIKNDYYYFREDGTMVSGQWVGIPNENADGEEEPEQYWYYFQDNGKAYRRSDSASSGSISAKEIDGRKYTFDTEGRMLYGWVSEGERQTGEDAWENSDYYFGTEDDGAMHLGWVRLSVVADDVEADQPGSDYWEEEQDRWFYFSPNGKKIKGREGGCKFKTINGNKYGFDEYGRMIASWYADPDILTLATSEREAGAGNPYQGNKAYSKEFMYFGTPESGARYSKGWFKARPSEYLMKSKYDDYETYMYYADGDGNIYANEIRNIDGEKYGFDNCGRLLTGMVCANMEDDGSSSRINYTFYSDADVRAGKGPFSDEAEFHELVENYAEEFQSHKMRIYMFGGLNGAMLTGKQEVQLGKMGEKYQFMFETSGHLKGSGVYGKKDGRLYKAGMLVKPEEGEKYAIYKQDYEVRPVADGTNAEEIKDFDNRDSNKDGKIEGILVKTTVEDFIADVCNSGIYDEKKEETVWTVRWAPPDVKYYLIASNGDIVKNKKNAVDVDGYEFRVKNEKIQTITVKE